MRGSVVVSFLAVIPGHNILNRAALNTPDWLWMYLSLRQPFITLYVALWRI